jgi:hypothetical protein
LWPRIFAIAARICGALGQSRILTEEFLQFIGSQRLFMAA